MELEGQLRNMFFYSQRKVALLEMLSELQPVSSETFKCTKAD